MIRRSFSRSISATNLQRAPIAASILPTLTGHGEHQSRRCPSAKKSGRQVSIPWVKSYPSTRLKALPTTQPNSVRYTAAKRDRCDEAYMPRTVVCRWQLQNETVDTSRRILAYSARSRTLSSESTPSSLHALRTCSASHSSFVRRVFFSRKTLQTWWTAAHEGLVGTADATSQASPTQRQL